MSEKINKQDEIKVIDDSVEAVRKVPDVYIGALGNRGYLNMYREIIQNSLDEIIKGNTLDKNIIVSYDARTKICIVEDNGQGIDLNMLVPVFSVLHSSSNYDKKEGSGKYSSGKNGMGATITNYLSKFFVVESYRMDGTAAKVEFEEGHLTDKGLQPIKKRPKNKHGLITTFQPSDMMGEITTTEEELFNLTYLIIHLCSIGTRVVFNSIDNMGQKHKSIVENKIGINQLLNDICEKKVFNPIYYIQDNGTMKVEVLFTYDITNMNDPVILGFANMCPSNVGTHISGFLDAVIKYFRDYMNKIYLVNNKKLTVNAQDIRTGLRAVVSVFHLFPLFTGQAKEEFSQEDMYRYIHDITLKSLKEWASKNPTDLQKIAKYLKEVCEIRSKSDNEKIKMSDKYTSSVISGLPAKYKKPNGHKNIEVIITEGDSAASGMENNRDKSTQGIMPIRGKIINAFTTPTKKYFENEEVAGLFKIFGYNGYSKTFDPDKFKPEKVIIATDADADGDHITFLLFGMFLRYLPFVIEQGKLYVAQPPLYGITLGKNKKKFFADNIDYVEYVQNTFCKENKVCYQNGKKISNKDLTNILYKNIDYKKIVDRISNTYSINPEFLEFILYNKDLSYKKFKSTIEKAYKFVNVEQQNGIILIRGLVGNKYQTVFYSDRFINSCSEIIDLINKSEEYYILNDQKISLYQLMDIFNSFEPKNLTRYKGLGEMNPKDLGVSTIIPGQGRTLKRYTISDVKKELQYFTELQSDKSAFIKGIKIRKEDIV